jgi:hypothetical protein
VTTSTRPTLRVVAPRSTTSTGTIRRKSAPPQPKAFSPTGEIGTRVAQAFALKLEIDRLKALLDGHTAFLKAHCIKNNISRLDVGDFQVQRKERKNWEYSLPLQNEMLRIQQQQKLEQSDGRAINTPTIYVALAVSRKAAGA